MLLRLGICRLMTKESQRKTLDSLSINPRLVKAQAHVLQAQNHLELQRHQIDVKMRSFRNQNDDKKDDDGGILVDKL